MLKSFAVKNWRCFEKVELSNLKKVNVITGNNASGKSALLEALHFGLAGIPNDMVWLNQFRGIASPPINPQNFKNAWEHYFRSFMKDGKAALSDNISIQYSDTNNSYSLDVSFKSEQSTLFPEISKVPSPTTMPTIVFERKVNGVLTKSVVAINEQGVVQQQPALQPLRPGVFIFTSMLNYNEIDNTSWFSQMQTGPDADRNKVEKIVDFIKQNFPFITGLQVLSPSGMQGMYAIMKSGEARRLQLVSSGIYKIITILLGCASLRDGIILIDEIENGIFYEKYGLVWSVLYNFAKEFDNQIFVTSHCAECLEGLGSVMDNSADDFSLLRTERENGNCIVRHISGASMKAALKRKSEIRGASDGAESNK
ncbi:MAG: AAA family ATPase [Dehalococcoidales bacterium]|nr:AAA family ATPase [Dehalococcoidales bacterium]